MLRTNIARASRSLIVPSRSLHSAPVLHKTVTEKAKEMAENVNKKVGQGLASAIDKGENVTQSTKETVGSAAETTKDKSMEATELAKQKGNQAAVGATEAKEQFKKEVKK